MMTFAKGNYTPEDAFKRMLFRHDLANDAPFPRVGMVWRSFRTQVAQQSIEGTSIGDPYNEFAFDVPADPAADLNVYEPILGRHRLQFNGIHTPVPGGPHGNDRFVILFGRGTPEDRKYYGRLGVHITDEMAQQYARAKLR